MSSLANIIAEIRKHRKQRDVFDYVAGVIKNREVRITPKKTDDGESYELRPLVGAVFSQGDTPVFDGILQDISLGQVYGDFFSAYSLNFNGTKVDISANRARLLFEMVVASNSQLTKNKTVKAM